MPSHPFLSHGHAQGSLQSVILKVLKMLSMIPSILRESGDVNHPDIFRNYRKRKNGRSLLLL